MKRLLLYTAPAAWAALLVVAFETLRTLGVGDTELQGTVESMGFALAVAGMLGLPLWVLGVLGVTIADGTRISWRWGTGARPDGALRAAWLIFGVLALAALTFGVQAGTIKFIKWFHKPIYQGLAAGLLGAGLVVALLILAGPIVGVLRRVLYKISQRVPTWADPTKATGALLWGGGLAILGSLLISTLISALHTLDLRPARLMLIWGLALLGGVLWIDRRGSTRLQIGTTVVTILVLVSGFIWSAAALGDSQQRMVAVDRDTILAGFAARNLGRLGDADGDGVPRLFAGGDCDDSKAEIRPGIYDIPGDGIDQNCTGADLVLKADPLRAPRRIAPKEPAKPWHVVLITIDALREDAMRAHMPRLVALAKESIDFRNAYSHGAATYWSLPALLSSTMPSRLHMGRDQTPVASMKLLTEVLRDQKYHTALFANVTIFFVRGLRQGTHVANYDTSHFTIHGAKPGSKHLTDGVLKHVDKWQRKGLKPQLDKFFVWAHYYDPHDPYFEVADFPADDDDESRYTAILQYTDREIGRLIDGLKAKGLWEKTVFIVTADHGDEFLDHGHRFHGRTLYEEMTHVPLIMRVPGVTPQVIEGPVGHNEVAPTLLDLLHLPIPRSYLGRSRADEILTGKAAPDAPVFFEVFPDSNYDRHQVGMRLGNMKLIYRLTENYFELYDLASDPKERRNVYDSHPQATALRTRLLTYLDHHLYALGQGRSGAKRPEGVPKKPKRKSKRKPKRKPKPKPKPKAAPVIQPMGPFKGPIKAPTLKAPKGHSGAKLKTHSNE